MIVECVAGLLHAAGVLSRLIRSARADRRELREAHIRLVRIDTRERFDAREPIRRQLARVAGDERQPTLRHDAERRRHREHGAEGQQQLDRNSEIGEPVQHVHCRLCIKIEIV